MVGVFRSGPSMWDVLLGFYPAVAHSHVHRPDRPVDEVLFLHDLFLSKVETRIAQND